MSEDVIILACVDLGPHSRAVVERALALAASPNALGSKVVVAHVTAAPSVRHQQAVSDLMDGLDIARLKAVRVIAGDPAEALPKEADALGAAVIVIGASRRTFLEQVFSGSLTVALRHRCACPMLVARIAPALPYRHAVVAVDIGRPVAPLAEAVRDVLGEVDTELFTVLDEAVPLQMIAAQADPQAVKEHAEQCMRDAYRTLVAAADAASRQGWVPRVRVAQGVASREIRARVEALAADLLVLQPEAKTRFLRALVGSMTEEMLARPQDCDVLILPVHR